MASVSELEVIFGDERRWQAGPGGSSNIHGAVLAVSLRHTHATLLLEAGVDVKTVSERDIEEPLRTVSDPGLKLNGIVQTMRIGLSLE